MRVNENKQVFTKPVVHQGESKVIHVVCKSANCSGSSTNISINKLDEVTKSKVA
ncbi:hypothetical protein HV819_04830 [Anaerococcus sp. AGMB00486]|uniref:Mobile element protein n=1 Tax=Anaerococcus faecalis TaxID=2742993 RepID=A0ABX2N9F1_9FIRM|nr:MULTISPECIES: hypothetical protein [Anaerococcus]NVF11314.1 hypothetical protein [Anaerococcus faecalis]